MKYTKLIEDIRTIRDFKKEEIPEGLSNQLLLDAEEKSLTGIHKDISTIFIKNGKKFYEDLSGKAGYFGKMIEAPHYIVMLSKNTDINIENSGYVMENIRLKAWDAGLGTCWLSIEDEKELSELLDIEKVLTPIALIAIGYQYKGIFKKDISSKSSRLGIEDLVYDKKWETPCTAEMLQTRGISNILYYTRFAPSWGNKQPWRFVLNNDKIVLVVGNTHKSQRLDAGIVMLYFEKAAYEEGLHGKWMLDNINPKEYDIPEGYKAVGYFEV